MAAGVTIKKNNIKLLDEFIQNDYSKKVSDSDFYFNYGLDYDLRDSSFNTKSGYITSFYQTLPVVSENNEISNTFTYTKYKELSDFPCNSILTPHMGEFRNIFAFKF